jgi:hypothetical protein
MLTTKMAADEHVQPGAGAAAGLLGELQRHAIGGDDIVTPDGTFVFDAEDLVEIDATQRDKGGGRVRRGARELGVEGGEKGIAQIAVGGGQGRNLAARSSLTRRSCRVRLTRSLRPRAWGE